MTKQISLRWRLILVSGLLALVASVALGSVLYQRAHRQLLQQVEKTLETKCDEVITVLQSPDPNPTLVEFLIIETNYRFTPYTYFYEIRGADGESLMRSENLDGNSLPTPDEWTRGDGASQAHFRTTAHPTAGASERVRIRSEHVVIHGIAGARELTIQTAVSLAPFEAATLSMLKRAMLVAAGALLIVFFLLWFVTSRALRPVTTMTRKAAQISATNLRERLPLAGRADELDELAHVLNDMLDRLSISLRQMEQFSSDAAHQLRTPLTRIRSVLEVILRDDIPQELREQLDYVRGEAERLSRLCGRLLLLARLDQQKGDPALLEDSVELREVVEELIEQTAPLARERGIDLQAGKLAPDHIRGNRTLLVEALLNLLDNALACTPQGGRVRVSVDSAAGAVHLAVEDSGPGVPVAERQKVFQPFYRVPCVRAKGADEGHGLGLPIVKAIAEAHGGNVELHEAPSGGSVFRLTFPFAARSQAPAGEQQVRKAS